MEVQRGLCHCNKSSDHEGCDGSSLGFWLHCKEWEEQNPQCLFHDSQSQYEADAAGVMHHEQGKERETAVQGNIKTETSYWLWLNWIANAWLIHRIMFVTFFEEQEAYFKPSNSRDPPLVNNACPSSACPNNNSISIFPPGTHAGTQQWHWSRVLSLFGTHWCPTRRRRTREGVLRRRGACCSRRRSPSLDWSDRDPALWPSRCKISSNSSTSHR